MDINALNKLAFFGNEEDGYSRYVMFLDDRAVMWVFASQSELDEKGRIPLYISRAEDGAPRIKTHGHTFMDNVNGHVDGAGIQHFVYPRLGWLLADLFVPKEGK